LTHDDRVDSTALHNSALEHAPERAQGKTVPQPRRGSLGQRKAEKRPYRLLNRSFLLLLQGQSISRLGDQAFAIALVFWIKEATGSASLMGFYMMMAGIPAIALGPIGGALADRYSRRNLILISDAANGLAVLSLAALMFLRPGEISLILAVLFAVAIIDAVCNSFFDPAISAAIPDLVPQDRVATANSLGQMASQVAMFTGQALGGTLYRILGAPLLFLLDGLTFLFATASESFVVIPQRFVKRDESNWRERLKGFGKDLGAGMGYIWRTTGLRGLVLLSAVESFFTAPVLLLLPFYIEDSLKAGPDWYGYFVASYGVGTTAGFLFAGLLRLSGQSRSRFMIAFMFVEGLAAILLTQINVYEATAVAFVAGFATGFLLINILTLVQITTPDHMRGRVVGLLGTLSGSISPVASGLAGVVADLTGKNITLIYIGCGVALLMVALLVAVQRDVRTYLAHESQGEASEELEGQTHEAS
jgi:MFS transporter, DHA3 family, macrolide efflux protein